MEGASQVSYVVDQPLAEDHLCRLEVRMVKLLSVPEGKRFLSPDLAKKVIAGVMQDLKDCHTVAIHSYDPDYHFKRTFSHDKSVFGQDNTARNKIKGMLVAGHAMAFEMFNTSASILKWNDAGAVRATFGNCEAYDLINRGQHGDEWLALLHFRNSMSLVAQIMKEWNKNIMEISAGILSGYFLTFSSGKPSKEVIRRHAIYHAVTKTVPKRRAKLEEDEGHFRPRDKRSRRSAGSIEDAEDETSVRTECSNRTNLHVATTTVLADDLVLDDFPLTAGERAFLPFVEEEDLLLMPSPSSGLQPSPVHSWACLEQSSFSYPFSINSSALDLLAYKGALTDAVMTTLRDGLYRMHSETPVPALGSVPAPSP